jgi:hypothetical protein
MTNIVEVAFENPGPALLEVLSNNMPEVAALVNE